MASDGQQSITVGSTRIVGTATAHGGGVRGDGGPVNPQLIVPVTIQTNPRPEESAIAVTGVRARLSLVQNASLFHPVCAPITESLMHGLHAHSLPNGPRDHRVDLRFFLTPLKVAELEQRRHEADGDLFTLYLDLEPTVAWVESFNQSGADGQWVESPFGPTFGMHARIQPFWYAGIAQMPIQIERSTWVRDVLPGLGYDRLRLLEITFPPPLPEHATAASQFDKAKRALDQRRYGDCVSACRGLLNMWETQYRATRSRRVADIVAEERNWPSGDVRRDLLDQLWKEVGDIANAPHHPEGDVDAELFDARDARMVLTLTAAQSAYVTPG